MHARAAVALGAQCRVSARDEAARRGGNPGIVLRPRARAGATHPGRAPCQRLSPPGSLCFFFFFFSFCLGRHEQSSRRLVFPRVACMHGTAGELGELSRKLLRATDRACMPRKREQPLTRLDREAPCSAFTDRSCTYSLASVDPDAVRTSSRRMDQLTSGPPRRWGCDSEVHICRQQRLYGQDLR